MIIKVDIEVEGIPGEKLIQIDRIDSRVQTGFGIITYQIFASQYALDTNQPMSNGSCDVQDTPEPLKSLVIQAAYAVLQALQFPTGTVV